MTPQTTVLPEQMCLRCGHVYDRASNFENDHRPSPGDFCVCIRCAYVMAFNDDLTLRHLTIRELIEAGNDPDVRRHVAAVRAIPEELQANERRTKN